MIMLKDFWHIYLLKIEENFSSEVIVEKIKIIKRVIVFILTVFFLVISYMIMKDSNKLREEKEKKYRYYKTS